MSAAMPVMFANLASEDAASSEVRFVLSPRFIMTSEKSRRSFLAMPSWSAASATPAISSAVAGISVAMALMSADIAANSSSVRSVVMATPVIADSKSMDA